MRQAVEILRTNTHLHSQLLCQRSPLLFTTTLSYPERFCDDAPHR
ncbi:Uncharacterised protein [Shigella sonnei]|nr:Uncharacterised protein [Shigella sonnei]